MVRKHRRPVCRRSAPWDADIQALPPRAWCPGCGMEIYGPGELCDDCKEEEKHEDQPKSL